MKLKIAIIFGTRPEAIKLIPLINELKSYEKFELQIINTGQHADLLDDVLRIFNIKTDFNLAVMKEGQSLSKMTSKIISKLDYIFQKNIIDHVIVHGDTTTTMSAALAAFYNDISISHIEAGLRSNNLRAPWPEEGNRRLVSSISDYNFAPTEKSLRSLETENVPGENFLTGNTVVDTLQAITKKFQKPEVLDEFLDKNFFELSKNKPFVLITMHRRENIGNGVINITEAISILSQKYDHINFLLPLHHNPKISEVIKTKLENLKNTHLIAPLDYFNFLYALSKCICVISDSGGVQEEAPSFGKKVFVTRSVTERPEGIEMGVTELVGHDKCLIIERVSDHIERLGSNLQGRFHNPYGDGTASVRIARLLDEKLGDKL